MYTELNIEDWSRRSTYELFKGFEDPFFNITANVDVSSVYRFCKANDLRISLSLLYFSLVAANGIREFRTRLVDGHLLEYDRIHATQTILNDDETFSFAYFEMKSDLYSFNQAGKVALEKYKALKTFDVEADRSDLIYYSVIPWVSFTSFKHATRISRRDSIPRIVFGKIFDERDRKLMPLSVEANHMIVDGFHVGKFFTSYQEILNAVNTETVE